MPRGERFTFTLMSEHDARAVLSWRYEGPYAVYNMDGEDAQANLSEMLDRRSPYYAVRDATGDLVGFFAYGTAAEVEGATTPALYAPGNILSVGLGMRPDLTGRGLGDAFVAAGLAFAREEFAPSLFRLFVLSFNRRAIRVYARAGFECVGVRMVRSGDEAREFLEMRRPA